jgi:aminoglycoside N3'-acetyltransferase
MTTAPHTALSLAAELGRLGVVPGDALMVHVSLRRLGPMVDGATTLLDALDLAVGPTGTLMMVLGAEIDHEWVNEHPVEERAGLLADATPYDPLAAPAIGEVGYLAEAFRIRTGTLVTDNPSGRFGARGRLAERFLRDAPWDDYYGPDSPLHRFCQAAGKVLRIGANPDTTTVLHYAEYLADLPFKRRVVRHYKVRGPDGPVVRSVSCLDDEHGIAPWPRVGEPDVAWPHNDYFAVVLMAYMETRRPASGTVGHAETYLIDASDIVAFGADWMTRNLVPAAEDVPSNS